MANTQELMLRIRGDNTDAEKKIKQTDRSVEGLDINTRKASTAMKVFGRDLLNVRDTSDLLSAATRALGTVIAGSLGGTAVIVAGKALIDAYRNVQKAVDETKTSLEAAKKAAGKIGVGAGLSESASAANALFAESEKAFQKIDEINKSKLQSFVASITGAKEEMAMLGEEAKKTASKILTTGVLNERQARIIAQGFSDIDREAEKVGKSYDDLIFAARKAGKADLERQLNLEKQLAVEKVYGDARKKQEKTISDAAKAGEQARLDYFAKVRAEDDLYTQQRERNLQRISDELERQVKINEERLRQEQTMADVAEARLRFERSRAVYSGRGGRTGFNFAQANQQAMSAGQMLLESTRAGRQALEVARERRARQVQKENFREGSRLSAKERAGIAAQVAAAEIPSIRDRAGGQQQLNASLERLISLIETAPLVTSGAGSN